MVFNFFEAMLWFMFSGAFAYTAFSKDSNKLYKNNLILTGVLFLLFGISDLIEMQTGAWWMPVELLVLKGGCILGFIVCFIRYRQLLKKKL